MYLSRCSPIICWGASVYSQYISFLWWETPVPKMTQPSYLPIGNLGRGCWIWPLAPNSGFSKVEFGLRELQCVLKAQWKLLLVPIMGTLMFLPLAGFVMPLVHWCCLYLADGKGWIPVSLFPSCPLAWCKGSHQVPGRILPFLLKSLPDRVSARDRSQRVAGQPAATKGTASTMASCCLPGWHGSYWLLGLLGSSCKPVTALPTCSRKEPGGHLSLLSTFVLDDLHTHMHTLIVMVEGSR